MPYLADPVAASALEEAVAVRAGRRLRALLPLITAHGGPGLSALTADVLAAARAGGEPSLPLAGSDLRGLIAQLEQARRLAHDAARASDGRPASIARLFAEVAATPYLLQVAPHQIPDAGFTARASALADRLRDAALADLPLALAPHTRRGVVGAAFPLLPREDSEVGRARGEFPLGGTRFVLRVAAGSAATLAVAGFRLTVSRGVTAGPSLLLDVRHLAPARVLGIRLDALPLVPGTRGIRLSRRLLSTRHRLRVGAPVAGLERRLGLALRLLEAAFPAAAAEVSIFTDRVVPLDEPGTVSYSYPSRPGVSYINVFGKSGIETADDLLHETAHHKLHAIEELEPLVQGSDEALWWSPWRSAFRPIRGIVHACFTFTYGAQLFAALLSTGARELTLSRRVFAARRLLEEDLALGFSVRDLRRAALRGLLTPSGRELGAELRRVHAADIAPAARSARRWLERAGARGALVEVDRARRALERMRDAEPGRFELHTTTADSTSRSSAIRRRRASSAST